MGFFDKNKLNENENIERGQSEQDELHTTYEQGKVLDEYMAGLWSYDMENPKLGMKSPEELNKIFFNRDFDFNASAYQAGELSYLSYYGARIVYSLLAEKRQKAQVEQAGVDEEQVSENVNSESKSVESGAEEESLEEKQKTELLNVTRNRLTYIHQGLRTWIQDLPGFYYYKSSKTNMPFIDGAGRVFIFIVDESIAKARANSEKTSEFELAYTNDIKAFADLLFLNACESLIVNDGVLPFEANRVDLLPSSESEASEDVISENNRILRYFITLFHQTIQSDIDENNEDALKVRQMALVQLEAQISARLLQAKARFVLTDSVEENQEVQLMMLSDNDNRSAVGAFLDTKNNLEGKEYSYKTLPLLPVAMQIYSEFQQSADPRVKGIVINPGELNFYLDLAWIERMIKFAEYWKNNQEKEAE